MRTRLATITVLLAALAVPAGASAAVAACSTKTVKVKAHHWVKVKKVDRHGHAIRRHGKFVYKHKRTPNGSIVVVRKWVAYTKTEKKKVCPKTTAATPALALRASLDPSFTQDPNNPLVLTFSVSASAVKDGEILNDLPTGVLQLFLDGGLVDTLNVGGQVTGGQMTVTLAAYGQHVTNLVYVSGTDSATTGNETINVPAPLTAPPPSGGGGGGSSPVPTTTSLSVTANGCSRVAIPARVVGNQILEWAPSDQCSYTADATTDGTNVTITGPFGVICTGMASCAFTMNTPASAAPHFTAQGDALAAVWTASCPGFTGTVTADAAGDGQHQASSSGPVAIPQDSLCA